MAKIQNNDTSHACFCPPAPFPFITTKEIINIPPTSSTVLD